jgi:hypothetical protein
LSPESVQPLLFLQKGHNQKRLHLGRGYLPPAQFEGGLLAESAKDSDCGNFVHDEFSEAHPKNTTAYGPEIRSA